MASLSGEATEGVVSMGEQPSSSTAGNARNAGGSLQMCETGSASSPREKGKDINSASVGLTTTSSSSSLPPRIGRNSQDSDVTRGQREGRDPAGSVPLTSAKVKEQALWQRLESIMAAKQSHVQQVLEEFGIADVPPSSDPLEEQVWRVVQGELTLQEAADLV